MEATSSLSPLAAQLDSLMNADLSRPWCVHRLYEGVADRGQAADREVMLVATERAADELVVMGHARKEYVSAVAIGVHCEDCLYWSHDARRDRLADFGPEYEEPTILHRMASHFRCRGL
jgi:hypothetical protein